MAFDCVIVDFNNKDSKRNLAVILQKFPHARTIPFISSYFDIVKSVLVESTTEYQWLLSSKIDYTDFNFDYIRGVIGRPIRFGIYEVSDIFSRVLQRPIPPRLLYLIKNFNNDSYGATNCFLMYLL